MDHRASAQTPDAPSEAYLLSRRALIQGAAAAGLGAATTALLGRPAPAVGAARSARAEAWDWRVFDDGVEAAMRTFDMVGAAVAVVTGAGISHSRTFGVRDRATGAPVTPQTLFRIGSATKSMTALLVATFVDEKLLGWDQRVVKVWPEFRAPSDALSSKLRVRDLMGMATGLGEPGRIGLHYDDPGALELLQLLANLPVLTPPYTTWYYNNPVFASAGYLPPLLQGVGADELESAYARLMQERVFGPVGMATARLGDDPRPCTADYATGYAPDLVEGVAAEPWVPIGSTMPAGGVLASLTDMAAHVRMQLRRGESAGGKRVVSSRNLEECWRPHVDVPLAPTDGPSLVSGGYGMGWIDYTYTKGRRLVWHSGFWDGFGAFIGFFPEEDLGLVILANRSVASTSYFYKYVLNLLLEERFGLNRGVNGAVVAAYRDSVGALADLAAQARPVDPAAIAPYLGDYAHGYRLAYDAAGALRLHVGGRAVRVLAMPDGSYVAASGQVAGSPILLARNRAGAPVLTLLDETVRWLSGPP